MSKFKQTIKIIEEGLLKPMSDTDIETVNKEIAEERRQRIANYSKIAVSQSESVMKELSAAKMDPTPIVSQIVISPFGGKIKQLVDLSKLIDSTGEKRVEGLITFYNRFEKMENFAKEHNSDFKFSLEHYNAFDPDKDPFGFYRGVLFYVAPISKHNIAFEAISTSNIPYHTSKDLSDRIFESYKLKWLAIADVFNFAERELKLTIETDSSKANSVYARSIFLFKVIDDKHRQKEFTLESPGSSVEKTKAEIKEFIENRS